MNGNVQIETVLFAVVVSILVFIFSTSLHELSHWMVCKILKCRVIGMKVLFFYFNGDKWSFQPRGKNHCAFLSDDKSKMKKVAAAGPLIEIIIATGCTTVAFTVQQTWLKYGLFGGTIIILVSVICNLLPRINGDGRLLFEKAKQGDND